MSKHQLKQKDNHKYHNNTTPQTSKNTHQQNNKANNQLNQYIINPNYITPTPNIITNTNNKRIQHQ